MNQDLCQWDFTVGGARQHDAAGIKTKQLSKCLVGCHSHSRLGQKLMEETGFNALSRHAWLRHHDSGFLYLTLEVSIFPSGIYSKCFFPSAWAGKWLNCKHFISLYPAVWMNLDTFTALFNSKDEFCLKTNIFPHKSSNESGGQIDIFKSSKSHVLNGTFYPV